jgi:hypothetical protein
MNVMSLINIINASVLIIGLPTLLKVAIDVGKRLQILDHLQMTVNSLEKNVDEIRSDTRELRIEVSEVKSKVNIVWEWFTKYALNEKRAA